MEKARSDILIKDFEESKAVIFEVKCSKQAKDLEKACQKAKKQIKDKNYETEMDDEGIDVKAYGISFWKKDVW